MCALFLLTKSHNGTQWQILVFECAADFKDSFYDNIYSWEYEMGTPYIYILDELWKGLYRMDNVEKYDTTF